MGVQRHQEIKGRVPLWMGLIGGNTSAVGAFRFAAFQCFFGRECVQGLWKAYTGDEQRISQILIYSDFMLKDCGNVTKIATYFFSRFHLLLYLQLLQSAIQPRSLVLLRRSVSCSWFMVKTLIFQERCVLSDSLLQTGIIAIVKSFHLESGNKLCNSLTDSKGVKKSRRREWRLDYNGVVFTILLKIWRNMN